MVSDGQTETLAFTEADNSISTGLSFNGALWKRPTDTFGISYLQNGLSDARKSYLAAGGISFFIGDTAGPGQTLNYAPERIFETYYSWGVYKNVWLSANFQHVNNPAYNADRGPANFFGVRLHAEY
jgi:carbohydrate-selective porin OprB